MALSKKNAIKFFLLFSFIFWIQAAAWPFSAGRDGYSYLYYIYDYWNPNPDSVFTMMFRTPLAPIFTYFQVEVLGAPLVEFFMWVIFLAVLWLMYRIGSFWSPMVGFFLSILMALQPGWGALFHVFSNEPIYTILVPIVFFTFIVAESKRSYWFVFCGLAVSALLLVRPGIFTFLFIIPFLCKKWTKKEKLTRSLIFLMVLAPFYLSWSYRNYHKFQIFSFAPGANVLLPMARLLAVEKTINSKNGPSSLVLVEKIESEILAKNPIYEGWTGDKFLFEKAHYFDLIQMADRVWGKGNYEILQRASMEALFASPLPYVKGVGKNFFLTFAGNLKFPIPLTSGARVYAHKSHVAFQAEGRDQWVPIADFDFSVSRWDPILAEKVKKEGPNFYKAWKRSFDFPIWNGSLFLGKILNVFSYLFPPILLFLVFGVWGWCRTGIVDDKDKILIAFTFFCLATNLLACMSMWSVVYEYRIPFDPIYILFGLVPWVRVFLQRKEIRTSRK